MLLAAGSGRKFWPYNEVRNKCAFPIANEPVVLRLAWQARELGLRRIVVVVGAHEASVRAALRRSADGLVYARQTDSGPTGTTAATLTGLAAAGHTDPDTALIVIYGDIVVASDDLRALWTLYCATRPDAAALVARTDPRSARDWIGAWIEQRPGGECVLRGVQGHAYDAPHRMVGAFVLGPRALAFLQAQPPVMSHVPVGGMPPQELEIADALGHMLDDGVEVAALETRHAAVDMDKPWHILEASEAVLRWSASACANCSVDSSARVSEGADIRGSVVVGRDAEIGARVQINGPAWIGPGARVVNGAILESGVMVGAASRVSDYCLVGAGSVCGSRCVIGHGAEFEGVMLDGAFIYHYSEVFGVVGESVDIGAATVCGTLRFDDANTIHKIGGRREHPDTGANATYFGDYSRTGVNVITQPGVKIGAYTCVGPGIVVYDDIPSRKLVLLQQTTQVREWGPERYGW